MQRYDNDTFFKAVHWAKRNIRKGKSRLNTYKAAQSYYGIPSHMIQSYLLKYETEFMSIDYRKYPNFTIEEYKAQKRFEALMARSSVVKSTASFEIRCKPIDNFPEDFTQEDINMIKLAELNKTFKEIEQQKEEKRQARLKRLSQSEVHVDPFADL